MKKIFISLFLIPFLLASLGCKRETPAPAENEAKQEEKYRIAIVYFAPDPAADGTMNAFLEGLREEGFVEGQNLEVQKAHAQGEISMIPSIMQNFDSQGLDLIVPMSTPCLTAAAATVKNTQIVFLYIYDPVAAGAGKSFTDHLPNITGVGSFPPIEDTVDILMKLVPHAKRVGTIYNSSEANSRRVVVVAREEFTKRGVKLEEATLTNTNEVYTAAQAVVARGIDAFFLSGDNTALQAFEAVVKVTSDAKLPLIINDPEFIEKGAVAAVGIGWTATGQAAAKKAARVLRGEDPKDIPFENVAVKRLVLNPEAAAKIGMTIPEEVTKMAQDN